MMRAADLFCGGFSARVMSRATFVNEAHLFWRLNLAIKHRMARWTENPKHVSLILIHCSPCAVALESRLVSNLQDARFRTAFAGSRQIGIPLSKAIDERTFAMHVAEQYFLFGPVCFVLRNSPPQIPHLIGVLSHLPLIDLSRRAVAASVRHLFEQYALHLFHVSNDDEQCRQVRE
jgi:hypothetical protein